MENYSINHLPDEMLLSIFSHLPFIERFTTISEVSQRWRKLSFDENEFGRKVSKLAQDALTPEKWLIANSTYLYTVLRQGDILSYLKRINFNFYFGVPISKVNIDHPNAALSTSTYIYRGCSQDFSLRMGNSARLKKTGDLRFHFFLCAKFSKVNTENFSHKDYCDLTIRNKRYCEKAMFFGRIWKESRNPEDVYITKIYQTAFILQIKLYVRYCANLNLIYIQQLNIKSIEQIADKISFSCTSNGLITGESLDETDINTFHIEKIVMPHNQYALIWDTNDYKSKKQKDENVINNLLQWSIFSLTTKKLSKKLGCCSID